MVKRVLIVEDEEALRDLIQLKYENDKRYLFYFANNGKEGLQLLSTYTEWEETSEGRRLLGCKIDLVVTDLRMPSRYRNSAAQDIKAENQVYDGVDFLRQINNLKYAVGKIVISAYGNDKVMQEIMAEGAFRFLPKPFSLEQLEQAFNDYFKHKSHLSRKTPGGFIEPRGNYYLQRWRDENGKARSLSIPRYNVSSGE
jgi:CheY-like chemotaxis protein